MQNIAIFYGGKSVEHDISVITAIQVMENIDKEKYKIYPIYITREGHFVILDEPTKIESYNSKIKDYSCINFEFGNGKIIIKKLLKYKIKLDCAINCCHGAYGEDGNLSGLLQFLNVPYTSCDVLSSSICMDKIIMKDIFKANNFPIVPYLSFSKSEFSYDSSFILKNITNALDFPIIVKPANLGSSIGITKCNNKKELKSAIELACMYDQRIVVEKCIVDLREINCSCLGDENCELSCLEEPTGWKDFLDFNEKYINNKKGQDKRKINPELTDEIKEKIFQLSKKAFNIFCCSGVVRIDYMLDKEQNVYINEINTIPGSMAFYLWQDKNVSFKNLIDKLIVIAKQKFDRINENNYSYKSTVLLNFKQKPMNKYSK